MRTVASGLIIVVAVAFLAVASPAPAACYMINFEELAVGTAVTTQYYGVTFSAHWSGGSWSDPIIYDPNGTTSSERRCLSARGDAQNEFSDEYIRMVFNRNQTDITFSVGVRGGCTANDTVQIRAYDTGGALVQTQDVPVNGALGVEHCRTAVRVERAAGFRRIEVEAGAAGGCAARFELIDDLSFDVDPTAPIAEITSPTQLSCVCNGTTIFGRAYDDDGPILRWRLERKVLGDTN